MNWRCGSSGRVPALQEQSSESNPNPTKKKKKYLRHVNMREGEVDGRIVEKC
jgi:hypothetical protein